LPNGLACQIAPTLVEKGCKVLDLSADYRFSDLETYKAWYGTDRTDQAIAATAVYGLPELYRDRIAESQLIGCPGCYPTASLLALAAAKAGLILPETTIIDAKSGTSGGGRQAKIGLLLAEADNSLGAYGVARHRHTPEIEQICSDLAGTDVTVQFTPT
jgi:N-acetyl-gamma-glutamyl-phosphate reductase